MFNSLAIAQEGFVSMAARRHEFITFVKCRKFRSVND